MTFTTAFLDGLILGVLLGLALWWKPPRKLWRAAATDAGERIPCARCTSEIFCEMNGCKLPAVGVAPAAKAQPSEGSDAA